LGTIIFAPESRYISETTRMVDIARVCPPPIKPLFMSYGGRYESSITEAGFPVERLDPAMTEALSDHMFRVEHLERLGYLVSERDVEERVKNEIALFERVKPEAVVTGFIHSTAISARVVGVPLVWVSPATILTSYFRAGLGTLPDALDYRGTRWIPDKLLNWWTNRSATKSALHYWPFNRVAGKYGLPPFKSFPHMIETDYVLLSDVPEMTGITELPPRQSYVGPFITRLEGEIPPEVAAMPKDKPIVYFAMGSSGNPGIVRRIIEGFGGKPYRVIAPVRHLLEGQRAELPSGARSAGPRPGLIAENEPERPRGRAGLFGRTRVARERLNQKALLELVGELTPVNVPENVVVTGWLPAHKVNPLARVSVIHGGQGTVYNALLAGTPIVGVGMQPEQEANLECLVRKGIAIRIRKRRASAEAILEAVDKMLANEGARQRARAFSEIVSRWDGPTRTAEFLMENFVKN